MFFFTSATFYVFIVFLKFYFGTSFTSTCMVYTADLDGLGRRHRPRAGHMPNLTHHQHVDNQYDQRNQEENDHLGGP